ncbi:hypothetical protein IFM58399_10339 [Aspergillus lentulus]|uniref:uncharacterized protein n=1 Tax=Aspergillus lentulus TaxID=293939 RepID=UPI0013951ACF|nr:uncharacterized protein IFM58399_10339 [Aspergillus lentulus]GFF56537.1 hypothetical protein IFM58399_10339 [Aspergillus lentulus]
MALVKLSLLISYLRFFTQPLFRGLTWAMVALIVSWALAYMIALFLACKPLKDYWESIQFNPPNCINQSASTFSFSITNLATDLMVLILPMRVLWMLKLPIRERLVLITVMDIGILGRLRHLAVDLGRSQPRGDVCFYPHPSSSTKEIRFSKLQIQKVPSIKCYATDFSLLSTKNIHTHYRQANGLAIRLHRSFRTGVATVDRVSKVSEVDVAVVSVFTGGAFFSAVVAGIAANRLGRHWTIILGSLIFCLGGALHTSAKNLRCLYSGQLIAGLGVGVLVMTIPLYQAEIAHPAIRGRLTGLQPLFIGLGATTAESPRWLMDHDRQQEALQTLARLHSNNDLNNTWVLAEYEQIRRTIQHEKENGASSPYELFKDPASFRRLVLVTAIQASVQMTGVSAIRYFSPSIYKQVGVGTAQALLYQGISYIWCIAGHSPYTRNVSFACVSLLHAIRIIVSSRRRLAEGSGRPIKIGVVLLLDTGLAHR